MTKLQILTTIVFIGIFAVLFFVIQQNNSSSSSGLPPAATTPTLAPLITDTFQAKVNLTPQVGESMQGAQSQGSNQQSGGGLQNQMYGSQQGQAQGQGQQSQAMGPVPATVNATIKTSKGDITLTLYGDKAPNTVRNFITKAKAGFYNNLIFHRVEDWVIQGGDPRGNGTGGGQMATEPNNEPFVVGSLGVARGGDPRISNDAQFFITKTEASHLNEQYTNFGNVTEGMDVVEKIAIGDKILGISIQ